MISFVAHLSNLKLQASMQQQCTWYNKLERRQAVILPRSSLSCRSRTTDLDQRCDAGKNLRHHFNIPREKLLPLLQSSCDNRKHNLNCDHDDDHHKLVGTEDSMSKFQVKSMMLTDAGYLSLYVRIVYKNSSGDEIANVNFFRRYGTYVLQNTKKENLLRLTN